MSGFTAIGSFLTHPGAVRQRNEDACCFSQPCHSPAMLVPETRVCAADHPWIIAVADGLGGQNSGAQASREVVSALRDCSDHTPDGIRRLLGELNERLLRLAQADGQLAGMGATVAGLCHGPAGLFAFNVGDARAYRQQDAYLAQVTQDDSVAQVLVEAGQLEPGAIPVRRQRTLTQCLGGRRDQTAIEPHLHPLRLGCSTRFLLCTDGLTDMVALETIEQAVCNQECAAATAELFRLAMAAGGRDNLTIVVLNLIPAV